MAARWCISGGEIHEGCGGPTHPRSGGIGGGLRDHLRAGYPWISTWGATAEEAAWNLPGDKLVPEPRTQNTLAVSIDASPEEVWGWLAQKGVDRAGLYTYLFVENTLLRLGVVEAKRIHPE